MDNADIATALMCLTLAFYSTGILPSLLEKNPGPKFLVAQLLAFFGFQFGLAIGFYGELAKSLWLAGLAAVLATIGGIIMRQAEIRSRKRS